MIARLAGALWLAMIGAPALACDEITYDGIPYTICEARAGDDLRLFLRDDAGKVLGNFGLIGQRLRAEGKHLRFAMNAGMYHPDRRPVGLYIEDGDQETPLIRGASAGNFGLVPNGVFCIADRLDVIETETFAAARPACKYATQSGPMLVIDGQLHPRFLADSTSRYIRNGVGTSADGQRAVFAISSAPVTFHQFGRLFRDHLQLPQALYLDGSVSRLHAPGLGRSGFGLPLGPIVGLVDGPDAGG